MQRSLLEESKPYPIEYLINFYKAKAHEAMSKHYEQQFEKTGKGIGMAIGHCKAWKILLMKIFTVIPILMNF